MMRRISSVIALSVFVISSMFTLSGCISTARTNAMLDELTSMRLLSPRPSRTQIFDSTPTEDNLPTYNVITGNMMADSYRIESNAPEDASYGRGFQDGCDTFVSAIGAGPYRMMDVKIDAERMTNDSWYLRGFQDASTFCVFRMDWEMH